MSPRLSCEFGISQFESMIGSGYAIDLNQGMDARLVTERAARILARLKWIRDNPFPLVPLRLRIKTNAF